MSRAPAAQASAPRPAHGSPSQNARRDEAKRDSDGDDDELVLCALSALAVSSQAAGSAATPLASATDAHGAVAAATPLPAEFLPARELVEIAFARLEESDVSSVEIAAWRAQLTQHSARIQALKKSNKGAAKGAQPSAAAAALAQLGRDCATLDACLAASGAQAEHTSGSVQRVVELLVAAARPAAPPLPGAHRLALMRSLTHSVLPRLFSWLEDFLNAFRDTLIQHGTPARPSSAWLASGPTPLIDRILAFVVVWQQLDLLPAQVKSFVFTSALHAEVDLASLLNCILNRTEAAIHLTDRTLPNTHAQQIKEQCTLTLLNKLHACWEAVWLLTWRLPPATLRRVCRDIAEQEDEVAATRWRFMSRFSSSFNNLLSMQAPPDFHPPCCMLCRRVDPLEQSTSHAISNCILGLYDVPKQKKQVVLDFNAMKPMTAQASKWKMCCKPCEGMFSSQGEDRLGPWLKQLYDPFGTRTLLERGIMQESGHVFAPTVETNAASLPHVLPLFHAILGNILRGLLYSGADSGEHERVASYLALVETLRQFFAALVPDSQLVIDYSALPDVALEASFNAAARERVRPQPQLPSLYCFASPLLLETLDSNQQPPTLSCGQRLDYHELDGVIECVAHLRVWGLHFVCLSPRAAAALLGDVPPVVRVRHLVSPSSSQLYLWRGPPAVPPELPALLGQSVERAYEEQRTAFHATSADDLSTKVTQAGLHMRNDVDSAIRATQQSASAPWAQSLINLPGYVTIIQASDGDESPSPTEFMFRADKEGMLPLLPRRSVVCPARGCAFHLSLFFHPVAHSKHGTLVALLWETRFESGASNIVSFMLHNLPLETAPLGGLAHQHLPRVYTDNALTLVAAIMHEAAPEELTNAPAAFRDAAAALPPPRSTLQQLCDELFQPDTDWQRCSPVFVDMERRRIAGAVRGPGAFPLPPLPTLDELHLVSERAAHACRFLKPLADRADQRGAVSSSLQPASIVTRVVKLANAILLQLTRPELVAATSGDELLHSTRASLLTVFTRLARLRVTSHKPTSHSPAPDTSDDEDTEEPHAAPDLLLQRMGAQLVESELKLSQLYAALQFAPDAGRAALNSEAAELFKNTVALHDDLVELAQLGRALQPARAAAQRTSASKQCSHRWQQLLNAIDGFTEQLNTASEARAASDEHGAVEVAPHVQRRFQRGVRNQGNTCWLSSIFIALSVSLGITDQPAAPAQPHGQLRPEALMHAWCDLMRTLTSQEPRPADHVHAICALRDQIHDAQQQVDTALQHGVDEQRFELAGAFNFHSAGQEDVCEALVALLESQRLQPDGAFHASALQLSSYSRCQACLQAYEREEMEGACVLSLPLLSAAEEEAAAPMSVDSLLQHYMREERVERFRCSHCHVDAMLRQFMLRAGPEFLCLQLLRFTRDDDGTPRKDVRPVRCGRTIAVELTPADAAAVSCEYRLQACVLHHSPRGRAVARPTPNSGHYTVVVANEGGEGWELYNDDRPPRVLTEEARAAFNSHTEGDPYLLIYKRSQPHA